MAGYNTRRRKIKRTLAAHDRWMKALELLREGKAYDEIAAELGYAGPSGVHKAIHRLLQENQAQGVEQYRHAEDIRIEALMSVYMPLAMGGNIDAGKFVDALIGRRAKLMGANAPERAPVNEKGETVGDDPLAILTRRLDRLTAATATGGDSGGTDGGTGGETQS